MCRALRDELIDFQILFLISLSHRQGLAICAPTHICWLVRCVPTRICLHDMFPHGSIFEICSCMHLLEVCVYVCICWCYAFPHASVGNLLVGCIPVSIWLQYVYPNTSVGKMCFGTHLLAQEINDKKLTWRRNNTFGHTIKCGYVYSPGGTNICSTGGMGGYAACILMNTS